MYDTLVLNANLATMRAGGAPYGTVRDGAIGISAGRIAWVGPRAELQGAPETLATEAMLNRFEPLSVTVPDGA